jgi:hypothetical protein
MENCRIINNQSGFLHLDAAMNNQNDHTVNIVNCEFVNNNYFNSFTDYTVGISFFAHDDQRLNIVNSTFSSNIFEGIYVGNAPLRLTNGIEVEILNTIIYNNETEYSIILDTENTNLIPVLDVHHSIIEDGLEGVLSDDYCILNWDEDTISEADPSFMYDGEYPYKLQEGSPAIDAGSLDLPEGIVLPEYDLAGNLRVRGNGIDIGAYEYNPYSSPVNENELEYSNLVIYPNPVHLKQGRGSVIINYPTSDDEADYELSIYNIKGQRVKSFKIQNSKFKIGEASWDLRDDEGDEVVAGVYFVRVAKDGVFIDQGKVTVVK